MTLLTYQIAPQGQRAMLGDVEVGRITLRGWDQKKRAMWISFLPLFSYGIRMTSPEPVRDQKAARAALENSVRGWVVAARLRPGAAAQETAA